jgi:hypothetical protein
MALAQALIIRFGTLGRALRPYFFLSNIALREQRVHRHRFETLQYAFRKILHWINIHDKQRPHQVRG